MGLWIALLLVSIAGVVGGAVNALMSDNGFALPRYDSQNGIKILRPGYIGNMLIGGVAAAISWGLYGPAAGQILVLDRMPSSTSGANEGDGTKVTVPTPQPALTMAGLVGGVLVGVAGARWLSNEVDKDLLRAAASQAALANKSDQLAAKLAIAPPAEALQAATQAMSRDADSIRQEVERLKEDIRQKNLLLSNETDEQRKASLQSEIRGMEDKIRVLETGQ